MNNSVNIKEPVTVHSCILKYAVVKHYQQEIEDSRMATKIPDVCKGLSKMILWINTKDYVRNKSILN